MNADQVLTDYRRELRSLAWQGEIVESLPFVTRRSQMTGESNGVMAFGLDAANANQAIRDEVAHYGSLGRKFEWKLFSFDSPPDLIARLRAAGFSVGDQEAVVIYDLADGLAPFEAPLPCEVRRIERLEQLADFRFVAETVFEKDYSQTTNQLAEALRTGQQGHDAYIAHADGVPASIGRLYTDPNSAFAGLYGGGTLPKYRSRGFYRAVIAARAHDALTRGARYLQVDALPTSLPILLRLGFTRIADTWPCVL